MSKNEYKRIVIKIGTGVITKNLPVPQGGSALDEEVIRGIVSQVAHLRKGGVEAVVVTSGAGAAGQALLKREISGHAKRQVASAIGQIELITLYKKFFDKAGYLSAQILVTKEDFRDRGHYANMKTCFENLLRENVIPIVNENDPIAASGVSFTDNDELAGLVASQLNAEAVIFLSSVPGVLIDGAVVPEIYAHELDSYEKHIGEKSKTGRGGMRTKFAIAKTLMAQGITAYIADGRAQSVIVAITDGKSVGTKFVPGKKLSGVKRRLAHSDGLAAGVVYVNQGAEEALRSKTFKSLLPIGVLQIEGEFKKGDTIEIRNKDGKKIGSGVAKSGAKEARALVGTKGAKALVHYDYLFVD